MSLAKHQYDEVVEAIRELAGNPDTESLEEAAKQAEKAFKASKADILPTLDAAISIHDDATLKELREKAGKLECRMSRHEIVRAMAPNGTGMTQDRIALAQGPQVPPHIAFKAEVLEKLSYGDQVSVLGELARHAAKYLEKQFTMKGKTIARVGGRIFVGHGRSEMWRALKDFIIDLKLEYEEFNRESAAGVSTKERLLEMLDTSSCAFLVMTAEDEHADGSQHARENVVHEVGLFQGRYGFERAIILLEEGCREFSNIKGVGQIRFPKGKLDASFNEVRRVLKREKFI